MSGDILRDEIACSSQATEEWKQLKMIDLAKILSDQGITIEDLFQYIDKHPFDLKNPFGVKEAETLIPNQKPVDPMMGLMMQLSVDMTMRNWMSGFANDVAKASWIRKRAEELVNE